jgi:hypothetical protein
MKVQDLREGLGHLKSLLSSWQAKAAASDLDRLDGLLRQYDDLSVAEFCNAAEKALRPAEPQGQHEQEVSVEPWLQELRQSESSQELFEPLFSKIRKMRNRELFALASEYCGGDLKFKKKADAIEAILEKHGADNSVQRQLRGVSRIF